MKKMLLFSLSAVICLIVTCCNDDNDEYVSDILLEKTDVAATLNSTYLITIEGGSGSYSVTIDDEEIAEVNIDSDKSNSHLSIKTKKVGEATITVMDKKSGKSTDCSLIVRENDRNYTIREIRFAVDADEKEAIEEDLRNNSPFPIGCSFIITAESNEKSIIKIVASDETEIATGTLYQEQGTEEDFPQVYHLLPPEKQVLSYQKWTINIDNKTFFYGVFLTKGNFPTYTSVIPYQIQLYEDLTTHYQTKYPNNEIRGVVRVLICDHRYY